MKWLLVISCLRCVCLVSGVCLSSQVSKMSIDFDSAALQTQQEEEEYDQEDYAREQEVTVPLLNTAVISQ